MEEKKNRIMFWVINGLIALIVLIFIIQNRGAVQFNFLGLRLEGYGFLVFLIIFLLGFFGGWLWSYFRHQKKSKKPEKQSYREDQPGGGHTYQHDRRHSTGPAGDRHPTR